MPLDSQTQTIGAYDLVERIAEGGMGSVYRARHRESGQTVAIKILPPHLAKNPVLLKRFKKEYRAAQAIDHPNIVKALEFGHDGESPYLVMEFVEGESLGQRLQRQGRLSEQEAIRIIAQVAQGLHKAHRQGLVHRDVKPDNILLTPDGQVKITDMGLVKEMETDMDLTRPGRGLGTPHFMAPEQFRDAKNADARCDIYSLAATLYMMVTGELPFKSGGPVDVWMKKIKNDIAPPRQRVADLSERLDWAIRRSMNPDPSQRAKSCREFVEDVTGHSTRRQTPPPKEADGQANVWHLLYRDEASTVHKIKGSTSGIRRGIKKGVLGEAANARISRNKGGPFDPLRQHPEFRDLVVEPAPPSSAKVLTPPASGNPSSPALAPTNGDSTSSFIFAVPGTPKSERSSAAAVPAPHIDLGPTEGAPEWLKWVLAIFLAVSAGVAGFLLMR